MLQEIRFQVQVLNPCKSVQESSQKVQDFKAQRLALLRFKERCFSLRLDSCSTDSVSVEIYEVQIFIQSMKVCLGFLFSQP